MKTSSIITLTLFFLLLNVNSQDINSDFSPNSEILEKFTKLSQQQLLDTAHYYSRNLINDTALILYNLIINTPAKDADIEQQKRKVNAYNSSACIHEQMCDYRTAYELLIKALLLCEKIEYESYKSNIYNNFGNIYQTFNKYDIAKSYYLTALNLCDDSTKMVAILSNLGAAELGVERFDSALFFFNKSLQISKSDNKFITYIMNNIAALYSKTKQYDSTYHYLKLSLDESIKLKNNEALVLSNLGSFFIEIQKNDNDSALHYINLSNAIAKENNFLDILSYNYYFLSKY